MSTATTAATAATTVVTFSKIKFASAERIYLNVADNEKYTDCAYAQSYLEGCKGACDHCDLQYYCKR